MPIKGIYCLNCDGLKGFNIFGQPIIYHPPCKIREYHPHMIQHFIAPKGYVSAFMKDGIDRVVIMNPKQGPILQIAKVGKSADPVRYTLGPSGAGSQAPLTRGPNPMIVDEFKVLRHFNIFGANLYYVLNNGRLYYKQNSGHDRFDQEGARKHLAECMRLAQKD